MNLANNPFEDLNPSVAIDQEGRSTIVWASSGDGTIVARSFDESAVPLSGPAVVHSGQLAYRSVPAISLERSGSGIVVWDSSYGETGLGLAGPFARCIGPGLSFGCQVFQMCEGDLELNGKGPSVDYGLDGTTAFAWFSFGTETRPVRLIASVFSNGGVAQGAPFVVDDDFQFSADTRGTPRVAMLGADRLVVVWSELGVDADGHGVVARLFSASGIPEGPAFLVSSHGLGDQLAPVVAASESGAFVVVWEGWGQDGSDQGIFAQRFAATGQKVGEEFQISSAAESGQFSAAVDMDAAGRFAVSWTSFAETSGVHMDIFARAYRRDGSPLGPQFWVSRLGLPFDEQDQSSVALSDSGLVVVAYESYRCDPESGGACSKDVMASWFSLPCDPDEETLCLAGGRFQVRAFWKDYAGREGLARAAPLTADSGGLWFFQPDNFELLVKVVDGCDYNQRFWIYAAGLTDLDVDLLVTDTWTGRVEVFENPLGIPYSPVQEIGLFDICSAASPAAPSELPAAAPTGPVASPAAATTGSCLPGPTQHCLIGGRFRVTAHWRDFAGGEGEAMTSPFGDDSGLFWFFWEENLELAVKVIDACAEFGRFWVYASGLTNVAVALTVEDTAAQVTWQRETALGEAFPAILDSSAFATCP